MFYFKRRPLEKNHERDEYTPLTTEYNHLHSRTLEEFPEGAYGQETNFFLGKSSGWDIGEEVNPRFSYENEGLHEAAARVGDELADPIRTNPEGDIT